MRGVGNIVARGRDGVLSRDIGKQVTVPHCDWNTAACSQKACLLSRHVPEQRPLHGVIWCVIPNFMVLFFYFLPAALCPVMLLLRGQSELIMVMPFEDRPTFLCWPDSLGKTSGEPLSQGWKLNGRVFSLHPWESWQTLLRLWLSVSDPCARFNMFSLIMWLCL